MIEKLNTFIRDLSKTKVFKTVIESVYMCNCLTCLKHDWTCWAKGKLESIVVFVYYAIVLIVQNHCFKLLNEYLSETCALCI
jgi:hypothetical protein